MNNFTAQLAQSIVHIGQAAPVLLPNQLDSSTFATYMYGGRAVFTVKNADTGARMTFKLKQSKKNAVRFDVYANLLGDGDRGYIKLGSIYHGRTYADDAFYISEDCPETETSVSVRAIKFLLKNAAQISNWANVQIFHENQCCRCGRQLTTPESVVSGIGPECARRIAAEGIIPAGQTRTVGQRPNRRRTA